MIKKLTLAAIGMIALAATAQDNYTIKMSMRMEGLPAEYAAYGEYEIVTFIKGEKTKTEVTSMMTNNVVYFDGDTITSLTDAMGNKTGFSATKAELEAADKSDKNQKPKIEYTQEKKTIAGYECTKAIVTTVDKDKKENKTIVWTTDQLKVSPAARKSFRGGMTDFGDLKGHPLAFEASQNANGMDVKMILTTTEVQTTPLDDSIFKVNKAGYKMMSYKEYMDANSRKGKGG